MSVPGTPVKMFSTPVRPVTQEKLASVREKVIRESPSLYKNKVLSDPTEANKKVFKGMSGSTLSAFHRDPEMRVGMLSPLPLRSEATPQTENKADEVEFSSSKAYSLGDFENPVLGKYTKRIVNKELETKRIISNVVVLLVWNLAVKFLRLFLEHTTKGAYWFQQLNNLVLERVVYALNPHIDLEKSIWIRFLTLTNASHLLHLIVFYNVTVSLWRLLVKSQNVKLDDLKLNQKQKELLGVLDTPSDSRVLPQVVLTSRGDQKAPSSPSENRKSATQPFLFKSLQTPLKSAEHKMNERHTMSAFVNKVNAFGDLRKTTLLNNSGPNPTKTTTTAIPTPINRSGYIPSSKYAYMMDSPSPRKRM